MPIAGLFRSWASIIIQLKEGDAENGRKKTTLSHSNKVGDATNEERFPRPAYVASADSMKNRNQEFFHVAVRV